MSDKWHGGKGDKPRKQSDRKAYEDGWDRIFGKRDSSESKRDPNQGKPNDDAQGKRS